MSSHYSYIDFTFGGPLPESKIGELADILGNLDRCRDSWGDDDRILLSEQMFGSLDLLNYAPVAESDCVDVAYEVDGSMLREIAAKGLPVQVFCDHARWCELPELAEFCKENNLAFNVWVRETEDGGSGTLTVDADGAEVWYKDVEGDSYVTTPRLQEVLDKEISDRQKLAIIESMIRKTTPPEVPAFQISEGK